MEADIKHYKTEFERATREKKDHFKRVAELTEKEVNLAKKLMSSKKEEKRLRDELQHLQSEFNDCKAQLDLLRHIEPESDSEQRLPALYAQIKVVICEKFFVSSWILIETVKNYFRNSLTLSRRICERRKSCSIESSYWRVKCWIGIETWTENR